MTSRMPLKVLVVEDNPDLAANLVDYLEMRGYVVDTANDGFSGLHLASTQAFDVILLDLILPGIDGIALCRHLRGQIGKATPILMLTARDTLDDKVKGLEAGADDYLVKPFALREVVARIEALARRAQATVVPQVLCVDDLVFDPATFAVSRGGQVIELPPIPLRLLESLMRASPRVLKREELERAVWGDAPPDSDALRTHLHCLRAAIDKPFDRPLLHTLRIRVAFAFAGLGALLSLLFAVGIWFAAQDVSRRLIDETLDAEMADYMARRARNPQSLPPASASLTGYLLRSGDDAHALPAGIAGLTPGRYDLVIEAIPYRVEIAERDGERFVLLFNETRQKRREQRFLVYLVAGAGLITLLVAVGGQWLAGQVIAPLSELAAAVSRADPQRPPSLARAGGPGDEIDELAQAFDHYLARLAAFIEREQAFAADASHELRTPLATIRGAAEVLADDPGLGAGQRARLARITRSCDEMGELIAALLLLSREEERPTAVLCDLGQILRQCEERYRDLATTRHTRIELSLAGQVLLPVQPAFVTMIVANLMHNAVAHTRDGSITVLLEQQRLVVADTGSGIPAAELGQVFERHFRGADSHGAGIGLSLVKRICERLGWRIALASHPVTGTTATLDFTS